MGHDFVKQDKVWRSVVTSRPCSKGEVKEDDECCSGFMDYGDHPNRWSKCSNKDFKTAYTENDWGKTCFDGS